MRSILSVCVLLSLVVGCGDRSLPDRWVASASAVAADAAVGVAELCVAPAQAVTCGCTAAAAIHPSRSCRFERGCRATTTDDVLTGDEIGCVVALGCDDPLVCIDLDCSGGDCAVVSSR